MNFHDAKLHLGCGEHILAGWINADGRAAPGVDWVCDFHGDGLTTIPDNSLVHVYTSHVIEHIFTDKLPGVLAHLRRALQPGGLLTIATTDLDGIYRNRYLEPRNGAAWESAMFGHATSDADPYQMHRDCFTYSKLTRLLLVAGFRQARSWEPQQYPEIAALNDYAMSCRLVSCLAEGVK